MTKVLFFCFLLLTSCNKNKDAAKELAPEIITVKIPTPDRYGYDTTEVRCRADLERANKDFKNGKLVFAHFGLFVKNRNEISEILNEKGIEFKPLGENCTGLSNCYGYYMDSILNIKFGKDYFIKIQKEADQLSKSRWKTKVYNYAEVDSSATYPETDDAFTVDNYCSKAFKKPSHWDENEDGFILANIIVKNDGKAIVFNKDWFDYSLKKNNLKHIPYLKLEFKRIITEMQTWKPAIMNGHRVNSEEFLMISF